ncbi:MAG: hypothetical protein HQL08_10530 [Nitrospirae bacterium]|nr:hypothetical protein [Nitrospirota bacterium]
MDIDAYLKRQSTLFIIAVALIVNLCIGYIDYLTGYHFHMSAFYLIPVFLAVWYANVFAGIGISTMSAVIMVFVYFTSVKHHRHMLVQLWNIALLFVIYNIFAFVLSNLKLALAERREALSKVRTLTDLVPMCVFCKKVLDNSDCHFDSEDEEKLVVELRESLSKVKTLTALIPSCASCKRVQNDFSGPLSQ